MAEFAVKMQERHTYGHYRDWPVDERWELIDGVAYAMSPAPSRQHQEICGTLYRQFSAYLVGKPSKIYFAPFDLILPESDEADDDCDTVVQPDS